MNRAAYYEKMAHLARDIREHYGLTTFRVRKSDMRTIYRAEGIRIDLWPHRLKSLRGAYFNDSIGTSVLVAKRLPEDPFVFTLGHELKHHFVDRSLGQSFCHSSNDSEPIEIGAEIFAAELIFPEGDFCEWLRQHGVGPYKCTPEDLVRLKHETQTTLSYAGLAKRAVRNGFASPAALANQRWKNLEETLYGEPIYKKLRRRGYPFGRV